MDIPQTGKCNLDQGNQVVNLRLLMQPQLHEFNSIDKSPVIALFLSQSLLTSSSTGLQNSSLFLRTRPCRGYELTMSLKDSTLWIVPALPFSRNQQHSLCCAATPTQHSQSEQWILHLAFLRKIPATAAISPSPLSFDANEVATNPTISTIRSTPIILQIITTRITGGWSTHWGQIYSTLYEIDYYQDPLIVYFTSKGSKVHSLH